uniref:F-box/LRR-repeat protein 7 n=2 Tax=Aceria tosichella TaxID=561515 RepID=A0A6G1SE67_9ACAR
MSAMWSNIQDVSSVALSSIKDSNQAASGGGAGGAGGGLKQSQYSASFDRLSDEVILRIFSYLPHKEILRISVVCKRWLKVASDSRLWSHVSLRPEVSGLHVTNADLLVNIISQRFGASLKYIELPIELITHTILHELASKCPNLTQILLDFSTAMQLHDFNALYSFPTKLNTICICLSEVIFMEGFMRKIYNFINGLEVLHLIGTYERAVEQTEEESEEIYEVINIHKLKSAVPNLKIINLYGINFIDDSHVEAFASSCADLEYLGLNFCFKFTGSSLQMLLQKCKRLTSLILQQTNLQDEYVNQVDWDKTNLRELDITGTELSEASLVYLLTRIPALRYLSAGQQDGFNDHVLQEYIEKGNIDSLIAVDFDSNENLSDEILLHFVKRIGPNLIGLRLSGIPQLTEPFWLSILPLFRSIKILVMGMPVGCCQKIQQKVHIDSLIDAIANKCHYIQRLEVSWDSETLRFSDRSSKAVDLIRLKCLNLNCWVLSDGKYFEMVKSNFERADRRTVVRSSINCKVTLVYLLMHYKNLIL